MKKFNKFNEAYEDFLKEDVFVNNFPVKGELTHIDSNSVNLSPEEIEIIKKWKAEDPETRKKWERRYVDKRTIPYKKRIADPDQQELALTMEQEEHKQETLPLNRNTSNVSSKGGSFLGKLRSRASQLVQKPGGVLSTIAALGGQDITGTETYYVHPSVLTNTQIYMRGLPKDVKQVYYFINFNTNDTNYNNFFKALSDDDSEAAEELKSKIEDLESGVSTKPLTIYDPDPAYGKNITIRKLGTQLQAYMTADKPAN